ncbi:MAG: N-acetyl-gamma-glutamyl-phosphate reductase [Planctomycetota bacterium]
MTTPERLTAAIIGGTGYTGGELLRLLLDHPRADVAAITSRSALGKPITLWHPNLRGRTALKFTDPGELLAADTPLDIAFLCMPHGESSAQIDRWADRATRLIDLSADFRLRDPARYERHYGAAHPAPAWLDRFTYGLPETNREAIRGAAHVSGVGCNATAMNLALLPLARAQLIDRVVVEVKVGSSEGGATHSPATHHPVRTGVVRSFAPTGHRHQAEVEQELFDRNGAPFELHVSATAIDMVRGVLATAHIFPKRTVDERELWAIFRETYADEPFVRIVKDRAGQYRLPEPKILAGTNYADVGFALDSAGNRIVAISAIDNLMKGAAGSAVQCMNLMCGFDETEGLTFPGLHPI